MSKYEHNATNTLVAEAVLGILEPEEREGLGRELSRSVEFSQDFLEVEETLADLAASLDTMQPSDSLRSSVLAALDPRSRFEGLIARIARFFDLDATHTRQLLDELEPSSSGSWIDDRVNGTRFLHFSGGPSRASAHCGLMVMEPNAALPAHSHPGDEWVLVLQGSAEDHLDKRLEAGDLALFSAGSAHLMRCASDEPFVAAVVLGEDSKPAPSCVREPEASR